MTDKLELKLQLLEENVARLGDAYSHLQHQHALLDAQHKQLKQEKTFLQEKNLRVKNKVENMIKQLKSLEQK